MSRAARASTVIVAGFTAFRSAAQAASGPMVSPGAAIAAAAGVVAAPRRKTRRCTCRRLSTSLMRFPPLLSCLSRVAAEALQHLGLVSVRIGDEEELRQRPALVLH